MQALKGRFVVFDGPDGSGKSTQFRRFACAAQNAGVETCEVREPGGTPIGEAMRELLLDPRFVDLNVRAEMLMYMASRAQLVADRIRPALENSQLVMADRFVSSTLAYQGSAGGVPLDEIRRVAQVACGNCMPDLVVIFDVDEKTAASRLNPLLDRIEAKGLDFHKRVRAGYLQQVAHDPAGHLLVDASGDADSVSKTLFASIKAWISTAKTA